MGLKANTNAASATAAWGKGVSGSGTKWSAGYLAAAPKVFNPANIKPDRWVAGVQDPQAALDYADGMANVNMQQLATVVNSSGQSKFTTSGTNKTGKMNTFMQQFIPKLGNILQSLDQSSPRQRRGDPANISRLTNYLSMVAATRGQN